MTFALNSAKCSFFVQIFYSMEAKCFVPFPFSKNCTKVLRTNTLGRDQDIHKQEEGLHKLDPQPVHRDHISSGTQLEAEEFTPLFENQVGALVQKSPKRHRGMLTNKNKLPQHQGRRKLVRRRGANMVRQRNSKSSVSILDLAKKRRGG